MSEKLKIALIEKNKYKMIVQLFNNDDSATYVSLTKGSRHNIFLIFYIPFSACNVIVN